MDIIDSAQESEMFYQEMALRQQRAKAARETSQRAHCADCGAMIPAARRQAVPGCARCFSCQSIREE